MLEIDGSDGGGQLLRSSLALAAVTDQPVRIRNIRGSRPNPGLKPQHLTAVSVFEAACCASVEGASLDAESIVFDPSTARGGHIETAVGTAGSLALIFDAVLPLAVVLETPLSVTATGGTAVKWSPPLSTYRHTKLPLCRERGLLAFLERHRSGFYPAGGGKATLHLTPSSLSPLSLTERGQLRGARVYSQSSRSLEANNVARRQAETAVEALESAGITVLEQQVTTAETASKGSVISVVLVFETTRAGFDSLGEPGKPAETVATEAVENAIAFEKRDAAVDSHLADQLLVILALAGGQLSVPETSEHVQTSLDLLDQFGFDVTVESVNDSLLVTVPES